MDGDAKGGAALSIRSVTGKPIKFLSTGEKLDDLEVFHPDRMASRILGMGDVLTLVEKAQELTDHEAAERLAKRVRKQEFTLEDFADQLKQVKRMGSLSQIAGMVPGMSKLKGVEVDDKALVHVEAIIGSMTREERREARPHQRQPTQTNRPGQRHLGSGGQQAAQAVHGHAENDETDEPHGAPAYGQGHAHGLLTVLNITS